VDASTVPPTPTISTGPKKSWFTNLFQYKPEAFIVYSNRGYEDTMNALRTGLEVL